MTPNPQPTQVKRPWRATARTMFQTLVGLASLIPVIAYDVYGEAAPPALVAQAVAVAGVVAKVMANPAVEAFLQSAFPFLSAEPKEK